MTAVFQDLLKHLAEQRFIINAEHPKRGKPGCDFGSTGGGAGGSGADREDQAHSRAAARGGLDVDAAFMALNDAVNHGQAEACSAFAFGGKERLETAAAG